MNINECLKNILIIYFQENFGLRHKLLGLARGDKSGENQENRSPSRKSKRPLSLQRSQSFQSGKSSLPQKYRNEQTTTDAQSVDNLQKSDGPAIRTNSFRMATNLSPIKMEMPENSLLQKADRSPVDSVPNGILSVQKNLDNIPDSVRKSIENIDSSKQRQMSLSPKEVLLNAQDNLNGSYLGETSLRKKGRYASMPVLNTTPPSSPKIQRLHSDRSAGSPLLNQKLPVHYAKRIDLKPYFSYSKERLNDTSTPINGAKGGNMLSKNEKHVNAFHDAFSALKKSQENLLDKSLGSKPLTLTQPKSFTSSLRNSAQLLSSHARLNRFGPEKFTKGSMSDLSHLNEDPWVRNKQRSYTESRVTLENHRSPIKERRSLNKPAKAQTLDGRRQRTHSVDSNNEYADNFDWVVYANRNHIPVSALSSEEMNYKFKYCTPPRGCMEPPPADSRYSNGSLLSSYHGDSNTGDSSISLSANTTSSETCSSPEILREFVFDESISADKMYLRDRAQVSRSFSTPVSESNIKAKRLLQEDRPASADILGDVSQIEESEKLVAEMERYMKRSTSSSGSLSSSNNRFPTTIPNFEHHRDIHHDAHIKNKNRHSCISNGSASSYESNGDLSAENQEGLVVSIKSKISTIASKIAKKKGHISDSDSSPSSPKFVQEDRPQRLSHFSFKSKAGFTKSPERDLPTILRDSEPGSHAIGSRMANADFDDYATFSLPRVPDNAQTTEKSQLKETRSVPNADKPKPNEKRNVQYGKFSAANLTTRKSAGADVNFQSQSVTKLCPQVPSLKTYTGTQSDSAFSIQSIDIDSSTPEDSPRDGQKVVDEQGGASKADNFYERRLSEVFSNDEAFRDSAVYCDDIDAPSSSALQPVTNVYDQPLSPKPNIKSYVQQFEQKAKPKTSQPLKVKHKEPGAIIKQRIESLAANSEYKAKTAGSSRNLSTSTSRATSRCSSRASSEDKTLSSYALKEYIESKFPTNPLKHETEDDSVFHRGHVHTYGTLKHAMSMGRLDSMKNDVDNLVIMKGWVKDLIDKFQHTKK